MSNRSFKVTKHEGNCHTLTLKNVTAGYLLAIDNALQISASQGSVLSQEIRDILLPHLQAVNIPVETLKAPEVKPLTVRYGSEATIAQNEPGDTEKEYIFNTNAEREAFLLALADLDGWDEYEIIDEDE
jgi:hypothetical protein